MFENYEVHIKDEPYFDRVEIYVVRKAHDGMWFMHPDMNSEELVPKGGALPGPTLRMSKFLFQAFVDAIAEKGFKPTQGSFNEGKLEAMSEHLTDMRRLVFEDKIVIQHDAGNRAGPGIDL